MYSYVFMYYIALLKGRHHLPHQGGDSAITEKNFFLNEKHILMNENKNVIVEIFC